MFQDDRWLLEASERSQRSILETEWSSPLEAGSMHGDIASPDCERRMAEIPLFRKLPVLHV